MSRINTKGLGRVTGECLIPKKKSFEFDLHENDTSARSNEEGMNDNDESEPRYSSERWSWRTRKDSWSCQIEMKKKIMSKAI